MKKKITQWIQFFRKDIWTLSIQPEHSRRKTFLINQLKIILLAIRKFDQKHGRMQAASLTYYSVLALVPAIALIYGLLKGFHLEGILEQEIYKKLSGHESSLQTIFGLAESYLTDTSSSIFAGIGLTILLWTVFKSISTVEDALDTIWGVKESKPFLRKLSDYLTIFLTCPLLLIISGSLTVFVSTQLNYISQEITHLGMLIPIVQILLHILPFVVIWILFTFIYIFMPNTQVHFSAALWGGIIAGTAYEVVQWTYIIFQVGVTKFNAMYGSLAAIPLFLVWLDVSWTIVLFGAEVSFAKQNLKTYELECEKIKASSYTKKLGALLITYLCVKNFENVKAPWTAQQIADQAHIPLRLVQELTNELVGVNILSKVLLDDNKTLAYQPAQPLNEISIQKVIDAIEHYGEEELPFINEDRCKSIREKLEKMAETLQQSLRNTLLKDL
ncbi:MAG: YihY/virulence factor BrkB family protein [Candidatus Omnitrophica bacterium]|nr:YihY/virulence factor BrkB family protein [Candidatus Omnitrophota bacterium]